MIEQTNQGLRLSIYLQPNASRDQWLGIYNNEIKLAITAPPVAGKANQHLIKFLAKQFSVAKSKVEITHGATNRHKKVVIADAILTDLPPALWKILPE